MMDCIPIPDFFDDGEQFLPMNSIIKPCQSAELLPIQSPSSDFDSQDPFGTITPSTLAQYLMNPLSHNYDQIVILDARFDYEFRGGKIVGARNINSKAVMMSVYRQFINRNVLIVFHCEFSQNRGPTLMRMFRDYDRKVNIKNYPFLNFPNICLLKGGYKQFFYEFPQLCIGGYVPMRDSKFIENGQLRKSYSNYTKHMLQDSRVANTIKRRNSMSPRLIDMMSSPGLNISDKIDLELSFSASQPLL